MFEVSYRSFASRDAYGRHDRTLPRTGIGGLLGRRRAACGGIDHRPIVRPARAAGPPSPACRCPGRLAGHVPQGEARRQGPPGPVGIRHSGRPDAALGRFILDRGGARRPVGGGDGPAGAQRMAAYSGILEYAVAPSGQAVLFTSGGHVYFYDLAKAPGEALTAITRGDGSATDATISPRGAISPTCAARTCMSTT